MLSKTEKANFANRGGPAQPRSQALAKRLKEKAKKKKKPSPTFKSWDLKNMEQYTLCDAIRLVSLPWEIRRAKGCRYIKAFEVGESPTGAKYDLHLKLKTNRSGPVVRNRLRLPYPVKTDVRVCVICPPDSKHAEAALAAGATMVGEESVFDAVRDGQIHFDTCICQNDSLAKLNKANLGRILGPKGLMPSAKLGTVVKDPSTILRDMIGGSEYRERSGVVRMPIGQLGFTPEELAKNIKIFLDAVKKDITRVSDTTTKELEEVVLSASHSPGFSLNGYFRNLDSEITSRDLSTA